MNPLPFFTFQNITQLLFVLIISVIIYLYYKINMLEKENKLLTLKLENTNQYILKNFF